MPKTRSLDDHIDELYAGPAKEFIARRDSLVKELRAGKDKDGVDRVKALRKPTVAAWAVNQLAHSAKREVAKLADVGEALREAHEALAEGKGDAGIRSATTKRRKLVGDLTDRAVALLGAGGETQRDAISQTLDAAVADPDAGITVQEGRLTKELSAPSGFGAELIFATPPAAPKESARREERRAARAEARAGGAAPARAADRADDAAQRKAQVAHKAKLAELAKECDRRSSEAQQAARDASSARQEVSRLQDLLVAASAMSKAAAEKARLTQWAAATAQQALRESRADADG